MTTTLFSVPTTHGSPFPQRCCRWYHSPATLITTPSKLILHCSPLSTSVVEEGASDAQSEYSVKLPLRGCKACGREDIEKGCNGEGRIQGGIATVPGFGWWPIKAYRPCPGFVASGGRYRRRGQSMDEVAFGRVERSASMGANNEVKSSKKKQSPKNFMK